MAVLLFYLYNNHDDRPISLNTMRCALSLPLPLYTCIAVDMLFTIVGHKIDGNYEYLLEIYGATNDEGPSCPR